MPAEVLVTSRADQQIADLTRRHAKTFDGFLDDLAAGGCQALAYRLSGRKPIDHICVKHADAFRADLAAWGYVTESADRNVGTLAHLSRWMDGQGLSAGQLLNAARSST